MLQCTNVIKDFKLKYFLVIPRYMEKLGYTVSMVQIWSWT
jgi:hypothetical protein